MRKKTFHCEAEVVFALIGGRWKLLILKELFEGKRRTGELLRRVSGITQKVLTQQLREMERHGLIQRRELPGARPHVEYSLAPLGRSIRPLVNAMHRWTLKHGEELETRLGKIEGISQEPR